MTASALRRGHVADILRRERLVVVLRRIEPVERLVALVGELADAGARVFEITFDSTSAADDLATLREHLRARDDGLFSVGAGTIRTTDQLESALRAHADFGVSPVLDVSLLHTAIRANLPFAPGAFTPTEIEAAWANGATFVKLFPASAAGPSFLRELKGPMPEVEILATGGVNAANAAAFLDVGAVAVGIGTAFVSAGPEERRSLVQAVRKG